MWCRSKEGKEPRRTVHAGRGGSSGSSHLSRKAGALDGL